MPILSRRGHDPRCYSAYTFGDPPITVPIPFPQDGNDHILYTKFSFGQPGGRLVACNVGCGQGVAYKQTAAAVRLKCNGCRSRATIEQYTTDRTTTLGRKALVAVGYPQGQLPIHQWEPNNDDASNTTIPAPGVDISQHSLPPSQKGKRTSSTTHPPPPEAITRSSSLPLPSTVGPSKQETLYIWIAKRSLT